jgi:MYXO-CTERM domain-containing protein
MRRVALLVLLVLVPSIASAQSAPPSKPLERAIKLYDMKDFYSATIELKKVLDGETGDDPENVERARYFMGKTFFQIGFYVPSLVMLQQIVQTQSRYRVPSHKWITALRKHLPDSFLATAAAEITDEDLGDPTLASVREDLVALQRAKIPVRHDLHLISRNALGCTRPDTAQMTALVEKLRSYDDNVELTAAVRSKLRENDIYAQTIDLAMQKAPGVRDSRRWVGELRDELELLLKSDKAWQTTQIAAEVLQEVTVQHSIGEADLGKQLRALLDAVSTEVAGTASYRTSPELCTRDGAPVLAGTPTAKAPMVVQPRSGCGCATGDSTGAGLLVVLLAAALRRRSRAASRTRSLRA